MFTSVVSTSSLPVYSRTHCRGLDFFLFLAQRTATFLLPWGHSCCTFSGKPHLLPSMHCVRSRHRRHRFYPLPACTALGPTTGSTVSSTHSQRALHWVPPQAPQSPLPTPSVHCIGSLHRLHSLLYPLPECTALGPNVGSTASSTYLSRAH